MNNYERDLEAARELTGQHRHDEAYVICDRWLRENPNDVRFLTIMGYIMLETDKTPIAYSLFKRCSDLAPMEPGCWLNLGQACNDLWFDKESLRCYKKGLKFAKDDRQRSMLSINLASLYIDTGKFAEGEKYCRDVLAIDPENKKGLANLGFCQLAQRNWKEGWKNYRNCLGHHWRPVTNYCGEPEWDGKIKGTIVGYAEQGIGDVIAAGSVVPDMLEWCKKNDSRLVLEVDPKLESIFKKSFPGITISGTRGTKRDLVISKEDKKIDASLPMLQFAEYFRNSDDDFPGTPYLEVEEDRAYMWKQLFKKKKKPVIGLAWRGGIPKTGAKFRQLDLEQLLPVLKSVDAHWVSLQYKSAAKEIAEFKKKHPEIDLVEYPHATLTNDYMSTACMVKALDHMVIMHTSVGHLAGALGVPCWTFVPKNSQWRYGDKGEEYVWSKTTRLIRQQEPGEWQDVIERTGKELNALFGGIPERAGKAPRKRQLRGNGKKIRAHRKRNNGQAGDRPSA